MLYCKYEFVSNFNLSIFNLFFHIALLLKKA